MAKTDTKAKQEQATQAPAGKPAAWIEVHGSDERLQAVAPQLVQAAIRAWRLMRRIDELEDELKGLKAELADGVGTGRSLVVPGVCRVSVARTSSVSIADAEKLRQLLGDRWADLVVETVSCKPTDLLVEMASDADDPMAPAYRELLKVRTGVAVRLLAEK